MNSLKLILSNLSYFAPSLVFASINIMTGTWVLYLPHIKAKFELNDGQIGIALFCAALGLLFSIPFIPYINKKVGVGRSTKIGIIIFAITFIFPLIAPNYLMLCASLFITGIFSGFTDISVNALVSTIEKDQNQNFMSAAHGFFSLGGFIGASLGSLLIGIFLSPVWHMITVSGVIIISNLLFSRHYSNITEHAINEVKNENKYKFIKSLFGLALLAFIIMFHEGAVEHWSNLFLFDVVQVSESMAGLGFIAFSLCMTIGRFLGDGISKKIGPIRSISYGSGIAFMAYFLILSSNLYLSVLGFGILGLGLSVIIPEIFRLAGKTDGVSASAGISIVSGIGFTGFLLGPVLLGLISNWTSLLGSFVFLTISIILALGLTLIHLSKVYKSMT